jgi:transcriptional regulator with XRE-family HTH domain
MLPIMGSAFPEEYRQFLERLKAVREESGLSQVDIAQRLRRPQSFVSKIESGERRIDPVELRHLAQIYGKSISYFLK